MFESKLPDPVNSDCSEEALSQRLFTGDSLDEEEIMASPESGLITDSILARSRLVSLAVEAKSSLLQMSPVGAALIILSVSWHLRMWSA